METIYFTGFHGVGKTMLARVVASRKNMPYLDTDTYISEKENKPIKILIQEKGIDYYKSLEKYAIKHSVEQGMIVSLSATLPSDEENRHLIKGSGRVIYLRAKAETIYKNLQKHHEDIPFLTGDFTILQIEKYLNTYKPYYEELQNYAIDIDGKSLDELISESIAIYNYVNKAKSRIFI